VLLVISVLFFGNDNSDFMELVILKSIIAKQVKRVTIGKSCKNTRSYSGKFLMDRQRECWQINWLKHKNTKLKSDNRERSISVKIKIYLKIGEENSIIDDELN